MHWSQARGHASSIACGLRLQSPKRLQCRHSLRRSRQRPTSPFGLQKRQLRGHVSRMTAALLTHSLSSAQPAHCWLESSHAAAQPRTKARRVAARKVTWQASFVGISQRLAQRRFGSRHPACVKSRQVKSSQVNSTTTGTPTRTTVRVVRRSRSCWIISRGSCPPQASKQRSLLACLCAPPDNFTYTTCFTETSRSIGPSHGGFVSRDFSFPPRSAYARTFYRG